MRSVCTILAGVLCTSLALAQDTTRTTTTVQYQRVSAVVGTTVTLGRESLGKVTEVVISSDGCIEYVIVQYGEGFVAVPWLATTVNFEQRTIVVQSTEITVERLRELTFTEARWPNFGDRAWTQRMRTVWGERAFRTGAGRPGTTGERPAGKKDRPDPKAPPKRPKDPDSGAEKPKLDPPKTDPPRKEPPKKDPLPKKKDGDKQ